MEITLYFRFRWHFHFFRWDKYNLIFVFKDGGVIEYEITEILFYCDIYVFS